MGTSDYLAVFNAIANTITAATAAYAVRQLRTVVELARERKDALESERDSRGGDNASPSASG